MKKSSPIMVILYTIIGLLASWIVFYDLFPPTRMIIQFILYSLADIEPIYWVLFWLILIIIILSLIGRRDWTGTGGVAVKQHTQNMEKWLDKKGWKDTAGLSHQNWRVKINNPSQEIAVFDLKKACQNPDSLFSYNSVKHVDMFQEKVGRKSSIKFSIEFIGADRRPYVMAVTDGSISTNSRQFKEALEFAREMNELISMLLQKRASFGTVSSGTRLIFGECCNCGFIVRGKINAEGLCPKCRAHIRMPDMVTNASKCVLVRD